MVNYFLAALDCSANALDFTVPAPVAGENYDAVARINVTVARMQQAFIILSTTPVVNVDAVENLSWLYNNFNDYVPSNAFIIELISNSVSATGPTNTGTGIAYAGAYSTMKSEITLNPGGTSTSYDIPIVKMYTSYVAQNVFNTWKAESLFNNTFFGQTGQSVVQASCVENNLSSAIDTAYKGKVDGLSSGQSGSTINDPTFLLNKVSLAATAMGGTPPCGPIALTAGSPMAALISQIPISKLAAMNTYSIASGSTGDFPDSFHSTLSATTYYYAFKFPFASGDILSSIIEIHPPTDQISSIITNTVASPLSNYRVLLELVIA